MQAIKTNMIRYVFERTSNSSVAQNLHVFLFYRKGKQLEVEWESGTDFILHLRDRDVKFTVTCNVEMRNIQNSFLGLASTSSTATGATNVLMTITFSEEIEFGREIDYIYIVHNKSSATKIVLQGRIDFYTDETNYIFELTGKVGGLYKDPIEIFIDKPIGSYIIARRNGRLYFKPPGFRGNEEGVDG